jgi:uncharacterized damage-inducible protein DinB
MSTESNKIFVGFSVEKLELLAGRIDDCLGRLTDDQIWSRGSGAENAVGNLVLHLGGNLRQWIGFGVDGKPDVRARDSEFEARGDVSAAELRERLRAGVADATAVIRGISEDRLTERINVLGYELTVLEAIYHVVEHFAQHTGQIIFATKQMTGRDLGYYRHLSGARKGGGEKVP